MKTRNNIEISNEDAIKYDALIEKANYYDRLQYIFKIKLNSAYGALTNKYFRFYDLRLGSSTTLTGQTILKHQCAKINEIIKGEYDLKGEAIIAGDTDSTYFKTYADNIDDAIRIGDETGEKVNNSFPKFMKDIFFCKKGYDDIIVTGREVIGSNSIFIAKKLYIINVVDDEGSRVDKMKLMGISLKKTVLPKLFQTTLTSFIKRLLAGEDWNTISIDILNFRNSFNNTKDIMGIGLPIGIKGIEDYTIAYKTYGEETNLPGHVRASILWNECIERYGDIDNVEISSGTKIKVFYLKTPIGKFKSIAIPTDITKVPEWFIGNFIDKIDINAQLQRLVDKPLENILNAVDKKVITASEVLHNELVTF